MVAGTIFGLAGGFVGYIIFGFWGAVGGALVGCILAAATTLKGGSAPPVVSIAPPTGAQQGSDALGSKLAQLKQIHEQGLITDEEYAEKKQSILSKL
ncbi:MULTISPECIES: SHOCT domain-containing protein [Chromobacterium]|uniref:SHOCT domain-containing protein n=1 Tax=Chromobacterium TaxID=535 RepID=UPI001888F589|nr:MULTISPECIES: SHOCT domain-containing protein [Chromobacterium]WON84437.1 SHOCT domain-containing protein [Chromobacterium haemolyticum]